MTTSSTLTVSMAHDQAESTMAMLTTELSRNQPHGLAWALGCLAQHRDGEVWSTLVTQVGPDIQRLAMCLIGDFALAEDAVQETLLLVRDHARRFAVRSSNGDDDARRWILGVAANAGLSHHFYAVLTDI
jgi:Sigma-70 region 2